MKFSMGNINLALIESGDWQLAAGRFSMGESSLFQNKVKNKSQLVTGIQASCSRRVGTKSKSQIINELAVRKSYLPVQIVLDSI